MKSSTPEVRRGAPGGGRLGLRERKAAVTRLALLDATLARLATTPFDAIAVRDLCDEVGISEPTFFKYFGSKHELLVFYVQLWSIDVARRSALPGSSQRSRLEALFDRTAAAIAETPRVMHEVIAYQLRNEGPPRAVPPTRAEKQLRFGAIDGLDAWQPRGVDLLIAERIDGAIEDAELPASTDRTEATALLTALFFGVPASCRDVERIGALYRAGIATIWSGLAARAEEVSR